MGDRMILNAAFLISRDKEAAFDARVKELGARHSKLAFRCTGPWPLEALEVDASMMPPGRDDAT